VCLLSLAYKAHPDFPLVFAGNRDEYHARESAPATWWPDEHNVLGGRDLVAGGTWLGITRSGRFGVVTNRPDLPPPDDGPLSRGELVTGWLTDTDTINKLPAQHTRYGGFSLLLADDQSLQLVSGGNASGAMISRRMESGVTGLSNTTPDQPWPKLQWLNQQLTNQLAEGKPDVERLMSLLTRTEPVPDSASKGVPATPFVVGEEYGTRCSTVITISVRGECEFLERRFGPGGKPDGESACSFGLEV
jgi:uncharacterized protein with NRDE domain